MYIIQNHTEHAAVVPVMLENGTLDEVFIQPKSKARIDPSSKPVPGFHMANPSIKVVSLATGQLVNPASL
jgi:hypothetical protein